MYLSLSQDTILTLYSRGYKWYLATIRHPPGSSTEDGCLGGRELSHPSAEHKLLSCAKSLVWILQKKGPPRPLLPPPFPSLKRPAHLGHVTRIISRGSHPSEHVKGAQPHKKNQVFDNQFCSVLLRMTDCSCTIVSCKNRCQTGYSFLSFKSILLHGVFIFMYVFIYYGFELSH